MSYKIEAIPPFDRQVKKLAKKYPSLKEDLIRLTNDLTKNPFKGSSLGNNYYKIRINITSKKRGKSGGARVITHIYIQKQKVFLLTIYEKSSKADISDKELKDLLKFI
jgi:mRNA-degrading endonuclease RelE of RelBE toxin-antitoxin system